MASPQCDTPLVYVNVFGTNGQHPVQQERASEYKKKARALGERTKLQFNGADPNYQQRMPLVGE
jgi:hypothetical protein